MNTSYMRLSYITMQGKRAYSSCPFLCALEPCYTGLCVKYVHTMQYISNLKLGSTRIVLLGCKGEICSAHKLLSEYGTGCMIPFTHFT